MIQRATFASVLAGPPVTGPVSRLTSRRLRTLGHHGVPEPATFARQLEHLVDRFQPVSGAQVDAALHGGRPLPDRAVWVTFDDGEPEVVTEALPLLSRAGITATLFVCPGVIDTDDPFWWEIVRAAAKHGLTADLGDSVSDAERAFKQMPDQRRREEVGRLRDLLVHETGETPSKRQLTSRQLRTWVAAGHEVGNHTWDHPLLDLCTAEDQRRQIADAHEWLAGTLDTAPTAFAYPNGNWSTVAESELRRLDYRVAVGFDHRLTRRDPHPLRLSRLRVDTDADLPRYRSILSGAHSGALATYRAVRDRSWGGDPRRLPGPSA